MITRPVFLECRNRYTASGISTSTECDLASGSVSGLAGVTTSCSLLISSTLCRIKCANVAGNGGGHV